MSEKNETKVYYIDEIDKKILNSLEKDCRKSFNKIAEEVGVTTVTVIKRVEKMIKEGIIKSFSLQIDPKKLGLEIEALILIRIKSNAYLRSFKKRLLDSLNVLEISEVSGENDLFIRCFFRNNSELTFFVKKFLMSDEIEKSITHILLEKEEKNISQII
ncbi:MAG: Lrp/AsnC family transcriptional regulator [Candidatus Aenigmarchaeota archaeon]|nr:Lrp/AsnC family transcriptional regulator [Candidatus Aenigmarchaeota archaeon]MDW8149505.1 Lrp/AsnC family transcriptional regulator [Candidatus Aenigmarchaeota archaeon]